MIFSSPHRLHRGALVLVTPRKGYLSPSYGAVVKHVSQSSATVVITATSGGRRRGQRFTAPLGCLTARPKAQHRKPAAPRPWAAWIWR